MKYCSHCGYKRFVLYWSHKSQAIKDFFLNYKAHTKDFPNNLGSSRSMTHHNVYAESDWQLALAETGLEAMSLGKPVIGTRLAGIPEQINHMETGLVIPPGDAKALSEAIVFMLQDRKRRVRMGIAGQERFDKLFAYDKVIEQYMELYGAVANNDR